MGIKMKALLIIDIQNDYFKGGAYELVNPQIASLNAKRLLENFRKKDMPIFHIQHISIKANATFFLPNTNGVLIHEDVKPLENEIVITKNFPNSFFKTSLLEKLKKQDIKELALYVERLISGRERFRDINHLFYKLYNTKINSEKH